MNKVDWIKVINIVQSYLFPISQINIVAVDVISVLIAKIFDLNRIFLS
jgi:hypothetical protein